MDEKKTMPRSGCNVCSKKGTTVVLFHSKRGGPDGRWSGLHINLSPGARYCKKCAIKAIEEDTQSYVGFLLTKEAEDYKVTCAKNIHADYMKNGYAIADEDKVITTMKHVIASSLESWIPETGMELLKHNMSRERNKGLSSIDGRTWYNVWPGENQNRSTVDTTSRCTTKLKANTRTEDTKKTSVMKPIQTFLEKNVFPHEHFARCAVHNKRFYKNDKDNAKHDLLTLYGFNTLAKCPTACGGMDFRQHMHTDGCGYKVLVVIVLQCLGEKYHFHTVPGSHNLLKKHENMHDTHKMEKNHEAVALPSNCIEDVFLKQDQMMIFTESLIHAGGKSSLNKEKYDEYIKSEQGAKLKKANFTCFKGDIKENEPCDLSIQLDFVYNPILTADADSGRPEPRWYKNEIDTQDADKIKTFREYVKSGGTTFGDDFESAFPKWLNILHGIHSKTRPARSDKKPKYR